MAIDSYRKTTFAAFFGAILPACLQMAAAAPAQIPLNVGISAAKPNVMLMLDSSGSMNNTLTVPNSSQTPADMPSNFTYNCKSTISNNPVYLVINSTGAPRICKKSDKCSGSDQNSFGSNNNCFRNDIAYTVINYDNKAQTLGPYKGLQLNWYFSSSTFNAGNLNAVTTGGTFTRLEIAKQAAMDLVDNLTPDPGSSPTMRVGFSRYDASTGGGKLLSEIDYLDAGYADTLKLLIKNMDNPDNTPLATTLSDIGKYYALGESGNLTLHPDSTNQTASVNAVFSKANGFSQRSLTNVTAATKPPILGYCQKSYAILISDGLPNGDREVSPWLRDYTGDCANGLCDATSDWNIHLPGPKGTALTANGTACNTYGNWGNKYCKNGTKAGRQYEEFGSDYLDDVAQALYEMDLRPSLNKDIKAQTGEKNNVVTYSIGLADPTLQQDSILKQAAIKGGGKFYFAGNSTALAEALDQTILDITSKISSSASAVANSSSLNLDSAIYQALFDSAGWFGSLKMFSLIPSEDINRNGKLDAKEDTNNNGVLDGGTIKEQVWNAVDKIPAFNDRNIYTYNDTPGANPRGAEFRCNNLTVNQKTILEIKNCLDTNDLGLLRLNYLRGDYSHEEKHPTRKDQDAIRPTAASGLGIFRNRTHINKKSFLKIDPDPWLLGDIVNSNPAYVSDENFGYSKLAVADGGGKTYKDFVKQNASRQKMVYVGANDGMLHGFDASAAGGGKEVFAYIPNEVYLTLRDLTSPDYNHQYSVDGSPRAADVFIGGSWHTVLVGSTGAGGKALFALDITNPGSFSGSNVLWEISNTSSPLATDLTDTVFKGFSNNLGYTIPQVSIAKMYNGKWAAIVGNGYDSMNNLAVLYIIDIQTGEVISALSTNFGSATKPNGLSSPIAVDINNDRIADAIYAGDLQGNMWKFDVTSSNSAAWKVAYGSAIAPAPLFVACANAAACDTTRQPITGKPQVGKPPGSDPKAGNMVYFGTGKYYETIDNVVVNAQTQTFYGVWDNNATVARTNLQQQSITDELGANGFNMRVTSSNAVDYSTKKGWYMDLLKPPLTSSDGERVVSFPILRNGRIMFITMTPIPPLGIDVCGAGSDGTSWLMELDALTGSPSASYGTPWDITGDGVIDSKDLLMLNSKATAASGVQSKVGVGNTPAVISDGSRQEIIISGSKPGDGAGDGTGGGDGPPQVIVGKGLVAPPGTRESWRHFESLPSK